MVSRVPNLSCGFGVWGWGDPPCTIMLLKPETSTALAEPLNPKPS